MAEELVAFQLAEEGHKFGDLEFAGLKGTISVSGSGQLEELIGNGAEVIQKSSVHTIKYQVVLTIFDVSLHATKNPSDSTDRFKIGDVASLSVKIAKTDDGGRPIDDSEQGARVFRTFPKTQLNNITETVPIQGTDSGLQLTFNAFNPKGDLENLMKITAP